MTTKHPMQPIVLAPDKVLRFKANAIVRHLLDLCTERGIASMNTIAVLPFSVEDREQFAQLIGYSVSGFGDLSYARRATVAAANAVAAAVRSHPTSDGK